MSVRGANSPQTISTRSNAYRDIFKTSIARIDVLPWGIAIGNPSLTHPAGADMGFTPERPWPGGAYSTVHDYSADTWRLDHKKFGATPGPFDLSSRSVTRNTFGDHGYYGRYMKWSGSTPVTLVGEAGNGGYARFTADDTWFTMGASVRANGGNIYRKFKVLAGTLQIFATGNFENPPAAGTAPTFEIGVAQSDVEQNYQFLNEGGTNTSIIWVRRKPGVQTDWAEMREYIKGSECTGFNFVVPQMITETAICALDVFDAQAQWETQTYSGGNFISVNRAAGSSTGTLTLAANTHTEPNRVFRYTGRNGQKQFPAGGARFSALLPGNTTFGTAADYATFNKQHIEDAKALGYKATRHLDRMQTISGPPVDRGARFDNYLPIGPLAPSSGTDFANEAFALGFSLVWICYPDQASRSSVKAHLKDMVSRLMTLGRQDITIGFEPSNEVWNPSIGTQLGNFQRAAEFSGTNDHLYDLIERLHEALDIWAEIVAETGTTIKFRPIFAWASGFANTTIVKVMTRRSGGGSGPRLGDRMNAASGGGGYAEAYYFGGGQAGIIVGDGDGRNTIIDAIGSNATAAQYQAEHLKQLTAASLAVRDAAKTERNIVRFRCQDYGWDNITFDQYETQRHTAYYGYSGGLANAALLQGWDACEHSDELAQVIAAHYLYLDSICGVVMFYQAGVGRNKPGVAGTNGFWSTLYHTGYGVTGTDGIVNNPAVFQRMAAAYRADAVTPTPTPSPSIQPSPFTGVGMPYARTGIFSA